MSSHIPSYLRRPKPVDEIHYIPMKREGAAVLVEFSSRKTFNVALYRMMKAFPGKMPLTGYSDAQMHQIVLNTDAEVTYLKMIESDLKDEI